MERKISKQELAELWVKQFVEGKGYLDERIKLQTGEHGFGFFWSPKSTENSKQIDFGDEVVVIGSNSNFIINTESVFVNDPEFKVAISYLNEALGSPLSDRQIILFFLLKERYGGGTTKWKLYVQNLPDLQDFHTPLFWFIPKLNEDNSVTWRFLDTTIDTHFVELWRCSYLGNLIEKKLMVLFSEFTMFCQALDGIRDRMKQIPHSIFTIQKEQMVENWHRFLWAHSIFMSRRFSEAEVLLPMLDFFNHSLDSQIQWAVDPNSKEEGNSFRIYASITKQQLTSLKHGQELFFNYGPNSNEELLFQYGFVLQDNPHDRVAFLVPFMEEDPLVALKESLLQGLNVSPQIFIDAQGWMSESKAVLRLCVTNDEEFQVFAQSALEEGLKDCQISLANELRFFSLGIWILEQRLESEEQISQFLESVQTSNTILNLLKIYHLSQRKLLQNVIPKVKQDQSNFLQRPEVQQLVQKMNQE